MVYVPPQEILDKYARVLVCALNEGKGVKKDQVVFVQLYEGAKPLLVPLQTEILKAGAHPLFQFIPTGVSKAFMQNASDKQLTFFPSSYMKARVDTMDCLLQVIAEDDPKELQGVDPKKIMLNEKSKKPYMDWRHEKETKGKLTWTLALYGTEGMAKEAGLSIEEYWAQIRAACFLDEPDPVKKLQEVNAEIRRVMKKLNDMKIEWVRVQAPGTDLKVKIGANRIWIGASGHNIPSFEIWTAPDWRGTSGHIQFTEPLYRYGNLITKARLEFKNGRVVKATAEQGQDVLREMIKTKDADKAGEFSMTDKRFSRITKFMAETLYDENVGGKYGNTHLALGMAYRDNYRGDQKKVTKKQWEKMGFNDSIVHTDIVATSNRTVTATLKNGKEVVIYKDGSFTI